MCVCVCICANVRLSPQMMPYQASTVLDLSSLLLTTQQPHTHATTSAACHYGKTILSRAWQEKAKNTRQSVTKHTTANSSGTTRPTSRTKRAKGNTNGQDLTTKNRPELTANRTGTSLNTTYRHSRPKQTKLCKTSIRAHPKPTKTPLIKTTTAKRHCRHFVIPFALRRKYTKSILPINSLTPSSPGCLTPKNYPECILVSTNRTMINSHILTLTPAKCLSLDQSSVADDILTA